MSDSYLQLQTDAVDRVYSDNTANEATMGHGSSMTFTSSSTQFTSENVKSLMQHIRIVFFDPDDGNVISYARLNAADDVEPDANGGITMKIMLTDANGQGDGSIALTRLEGNTPKAISVLVYLDGDGLTNADVANASESMSGTMNLQFSSSATLTPMEYSDLRNGTGSAGNLPGNNQGLPEITIIDTDNVSATGGSVSAAYYASGKIGVVIDDVDGNSGKTVTIDGAPATYGTIATTSAWVADTSKTADTIGTVTVVVADAQASGGEETPGDEGEDPTT